MKAGIKKIIIASILLLTQAVSMQAANNTPSLKSQADTLVNALSNWRTGHYNSIFISAASKGNAPAKNIFYGDNFFITKDAKGNAIQPKLAWSDTLNRANEFIVKNAGNNQTVKTALDACVGVNNMIARILAEANKLKDNNKPGKLMLIESITPVLNTKTNVPSAESALGTLKKAADSVSGSWFSNLRSNEQTKAVKEVTLALIHVLEDALKHIIADFKAFKVGGTALLGKAPANVGSPTPKAPAKTQDQKEQESAKKLTMAAQEQAAFDRDLAAFKKGDANMTYGTLLENWGPGSEALKRKDADLNDRKKRFETYNIHIKAAVADRYAKTHPATTPQEKAAAQRRIDEERRIQQEAEPKNVVKQV